MTSEEQECLSRKYTRNKVMLQRLPTGRIAVLDTYYNLVRIIEATNELTSLLSSVEHRPPFEGRVSSKPNQLNINTEDLDI